jgi:serine-type D-Ala-D-Ala carboxypeptidase/endopeptidase (penicillin-binding protein 4)
VVSGSIPLGGATVQEWSSVANPTAYAADVFRKALRRHGVRLDGRTADDLTPAGARELAHHDSATLAQIATPFLKLSNNGHAEVLIKSMGRKVRGAGSWPAGLQVLGDYLNRKGIDTQTLRTRDGSGLSRANHISTEQLSKLLLAVRGESWYQTWYNALPIAGQADRMVGGTLRSRMQGTAATGNVHAKTGSLTGVSALSGYVTTAGGRPLVFSIVLNNYLASSVKDIEDTIAVRLADDGGPAAADSRLRQAPPTIKDDPSTKIDETGVECSWIKAC